MLDNMQDILAAVAAGTLTPDEAEERISALDAQAQAWEVVNDGIPTSNTQSNREEYHFTSSPEDDLADLGRRININAKNMAENLLKSVNSTLQSIHIESSSYSANDNNTTDKTVIKGDYMRNINGDMSKKTRIEGDMLGNIDGDMNGTITGDMMGSIGGDMTKDASIYGDLSGSIGGNMDGTIRGDLMGSIGGSMSGCIYGDMMGEISNSLNGTVKGDVGGPISGNLCGTVSGDVMGVVKGDVCGTVYGDVQCILGDIKEGAVIKGDVCQLHGQCYGKVFGSILSGKS